MDQCKRWSFQPEYQYLLDLQSLGTQEHFDIIFSAVQYVMLQIIYNQGLSWSKTEQP